MYTNAQSLLSKVDELRINICDLLPDVISITETWLSEQIDNRELTIPGFRLFRKDRDNRKGGGVATFIKNGLHVSEKNCYADLSGSGMFDGKGNRFPKP